MELNIASNDFACGVGLFSTDFSDPMTPACVWHDKAYLKGSVEQESLSRKQVDKIFYDKMKDIAGENPLKQLQANIYYKLVRAFGWLFWEGKK